MNYYPFSAKLQQIIKQQRQHYGNDNFKEIVVRTSHRILQAEHAESPAKTPLVQGERNYQTCLRVAGPQPNDGRSQRMVPAPYS